MKKPSPPFELIEKEKFIGTLRRWREISRLWGFATYEGVRIYWPRQYYYGRNSRSPGFYTLMNRLGARKSLDHSRKGISRAWLYLNRDKADKALGSLHISKPTVLATKVNERTQNRIVGSVYISNKPIPWRPTVMSSSGWDTPPRPIPNPVPNPNTAPPFPGWYSRNNASHHRQLLAQWISERKRSLPASSSGNVYDAAIVAFAPYTGHLNATVSAPVAVTRMERGTYITQSCDEYSCRNVVNTYTYPVPGWRFDVVVPAHPEDIYNIHPMIQTMYRELTQVAPEQAASRAMRRDGALDSEIWYKGYLRESFLRYTGMKVENKIKYLLGAIDNDYKKKKRKRWKKVLAVVVAIVIVVVAIKSGQWYAAQPGAAAVIAAAAAYSVTIAVIVSVAIVISVAATIITVAMVLAAQLGLSDYIGPLASFMNKMSPIIRVANVIALVASINNVITQFRERAAEEAAKEATKKSAQEAATASGGGAGPLGAQVSSQVAKPSIENYFRAGIGMLSDSSTVGFDAKTVGNAVKVLDFAADKYYEHRNEKTMRELNKESEMLAREKELAEQYQTNHLLMDLIRSEPLLSVAAESQYVEIYDRPYEWWATPYHLGCMQANTVHAMMYLDT